MKNKTTQGLSNETLLLFPKHDSLKYRRLKSNVNSHMSIQYLNQPESLFWSFSDLLGGKWCLQRKYMCRQHETLYCRKFHKPLSNSCHRSGKGHVWQLNDIRGIWTAWKRLWHVLEDLLVYHINILHQIISILLFWKDYQ